MIQPHFILGIAAAIGLVSAQSAFGQTVINWIGDNGDFFDDTNWDLGVTPSTAEIARINNGGTASIAADAGPFALAAIRLGNVANGTESGHVIMNGGFLTLGANAGNPKAVIGFSSVLSTFIMNGGTIFFDGPDLFPGRKDKAGVNNLDWEVGEGGKGRFEMHNNAVFRLGDDLKIAENGAGNGSCLVDGNAIISVGSGISLSSGGGVITQRMVIAGRALVESGNSMGAGNAGGSTDEGYLTMSIGGGSAEMIIQDNGVLNIRVLTARQGLSSLIVKDHGQFHIFDVFAGKGYIDANTPPDRPAEPQFNSSYGSESVGNALLTLQDDAQMTVNDLKSANGLGGLSIGGPRDPGNSGGKAALVIRDRASFRVQQYLGLGDGAAAASDGTLRVRGASASVSIGTDLNLAVSPVGAALPGKGRLNPVFTGPTHSTVVVDGIARLGNGILKISLDGYIPHGGESYTLISANQIEGEFKAIDLSEANISGLTWNVSYPDGKRVVLAVGGTPLLLSITPVDTTHVRVFWPAGFPDFILEENVTDFLNDPLESPFNWFSVDGVAENAVTVESTGLKKLFRLRQIAPQ